MVEEKTFSDEPGLKASIAKILGPIEEAIRERFPNYFVLQNAIAMDEDFPNHKMFEVRAHPLTVGPDSYIIHVEAKSANHFITKTGQKVKKEINQFSCPRALKSFVLSEVSKYCARKAS